ncbi:MAG: 6-hydroxymethylpterin diphosphokinase MptE-like protein [Rhodospirillales bacterium]
MTDQEPLSQEERDALREKNLEAFARHDSKLARRLKKHVPVSKLVFGDNGQPDIEFEGHLFYEGEYEKFIDDQVEAYKKNPFRFHLKAPEPDRFDTIGGDFLERILSRAAADEKIAFSQHREGLESFFVCVLGIGLGGHIDRIIEFSNCKTLIIVDPNIETLYHSLEVYDWAEMMDGQTAKGGAVHFLIRTSAHDVFEGLKFYVRTGNVPAVDALHTYQHYNNPLFTSTIQAIRKNGALFLAGLGFFDDEIKMMENTHRNLSTGKAHIYHQQSAQLVKAPCFIVGCGPSLDRDLEHIRRNADRAIVLSCGSALGPLLNAGVIPDFQIEVENEGVLPIMKYVSSQHDIRDICLVTSTTVEPDIEQYFNNIIYHFRPALSPFGIFSNDLKNTIPFHDPSVVNSGVGLAQDLGFRTCYFFGTDMGTYDSGLHHAKNSYHFSENAVLPDNDFCIPLPANFGGEIHTSEGLNWVKVQIEKAIHAKREGRRYYNCSDGALIVGTNAMFSKRIDLPEPENPNFKTDFVASTVEHCPVMERGRFDELWQPEKIQGTVDEMFGDLERIIEFADLINDDSHLVEINEILVKAKSRLHLSIAILIRGTLQMMFIATYYYRARVTPEDKQTAFEEIMREELLGTLHALRERATDLVQRLSGGE